MVSSVGGGGSRNGAAGASASRGSETRSKPAEAKTTRSAPAKQALTGAGVTARAAAELAKAKPTASSADAARVRAAAEPSLQQLRSRAVAAAPPEGIRPGTARAAEATPSADKVDPKVRAEAERSFEAATLGVEKDKMPASLGLPKALDDGMQKAWKGSLPGGRAQEQGGITVQKPDGTYEFRAGKPGTAGAFTTNYGDVKPGEKVVAAAHTHPYDKTEGNYTGVPFSGPDLANAVSHPDVVRTVQSGDKQFAAVPSTEFRARVAGLDDAGKSKLRTEMNAHFESTFAAATGDFPSRVDAAVRAVSREYGLGYYAGTNGLLTRQ